jgi:D-serine deaminase-like pyridoxal phosphate-dependent protein
MNKVKTKDLKVGDVVYYIPKHLDKTIENAEKGYVTQVEKGRVWVRYNGPQGALTPLDCLFK